MLCQVNSIVNKRATEWNNCHSAKVTGRRARKVEGGVFFVSMSHHLVRSETLFVPANDHRHHHLHLLTSPPWRLWMSLHELGLTHRTNQQPDLMHHFVRMTHAVLKGHWMDWTNEPTRSVLVSADLPLLVCELTLLSLAALSVENKKHVFGCVIVSDHIASLTWR